MNDFTLPTNIKQIGSIGDGLRIYMEDYVCTYLYQYAEAGGYDERIALLIGRFMVIDGQSVLFINGAVQGKYTEEKDGLLHFTEQTGEYADEMIAQYFEGMEIVGWMQSQPSYGVYLNQQYADYHIRAFNKDYQVLFVMDPLERINAFYVHNADQSRLMEAKGYFIYYDKNKGMHEYMLKNKSIESEYKTQIPAYIEMTRAEKPTLAEPEAKESHPEEKDPENIIRRRQAERVTKKTVQEQRRTLNLLVSLSAVLFVICFVMGAGLIQNQDRIARMEEQIVQLSTAYRNLFTQLGKDSMTSVFAAQPDEDSVTEASENPQGTVIEENGNTHLQNAGETGTENGTSERGDNEADNGTADSGESNPGNETANNGSAAGSSTGNGTPANGMRNTAPDNTTNETSSGTATHTGDTSTAHLPDASEAAAASETASADIPITYTIQPGDNLNWISVQFYGDRSMVSEILALNGIQDPNKIVAGNTIILPRK